MRAEGRPPGTVPPDPVVGPPCRAGADPVGPAPLSGGYLPRMHATLPSAVETWGLPPAASRQSKTGCAARPHRASASRARPPGTAMVDPPRDAAGLQDMPGGNGRAPGDRQKHGAWLDRRAGGIYTAM